MTIVSEKRNAGFLVGVLLCLGAIGCSPGTEPNSELYRVLVKANAHLKTLSSEEFLEERFLWDGKGDRIELGTPPAADQEWALKDPSLEGIEGTSTNRVYSEFQLSAPEKPIVVAVIDSGVDIEQEDLKEVIWTSPQGLHGWNFLGGKSGNIKVAPMEVTREVARMKKKQAQSGLTPQEQLYLEKVQSEYEAKKAPYLKKYEDLQKDLVLLESAVQVLKDRAGLKEETLSAIRAVQSEDPVVVEAKKLALTFYENDMTLKGMRRVLRWYRVPLDTYFNLDFSYSAVIGDDPDRLDDVGYGNADVTVPNASHGTLVAGIIGAVRDNGIGMQGQAKFIRLMVLRAVPDGDERDKDVGNAIRFAADNGARIINMSFGKALSPHREYVESAIRYAMSKGILLVHAAGNDSKNLDEVPTYPQAPQGTAQWIEVGASAQRGDENLCASFSNIGAQTVDLFAPGQKIYSTLPQNHYGALNGTSLAAPEVTGVAALLWSQFPGLTASQVRQILMESSRRHPGLKVKIPAFSMPVEFSLLSRSGGVVNAYEAFRMARDRQ